MPDAEVIPFPEGGRQATSRAKHPSNRARRIQVTTSDGMAFGQLHEDPPTTADDPLLLAHLLKQWVHIIETRPSAEILRAIQSDYGGQVQRTLMAEARKRKLL